MSNQPKRPSFKLGHQEPMTFTSLTSADRALAKMFAGGDRDWIAVDLQLAREKTCPIAQQKAIDKLTWHEAQLHMLSREAGL